MAWPSTHASLLDRLKDPADGRAWTEFDARYGELVLRWALWRGLALVDAEDVRQEVLLGLARALPRFEYQPQRGRFRSYLRRTIENAVIRHGTRPFRRREVLSPHEDLERESPAEERLREEEWEAEWKRHHLRQALREVRATFDATSVLIFELFLAGRSTEDVAREAGVSTAAAYKAKHRVRDRLRALVEAQIAREEGDQGHDVRRGVA
jgi:RNA polymerase sigma-70 factor (ECF subfamily)